jgi:hypothetical protein
VNSKEKPENQNEKFYVILRGEFNKKKSKLNSLLNFLVGEEFVQAVVMKG